ncbi:MAG: site-2 protease family protein, partial [Parcubacteria group bacterium]
TLNPIKHLDPFGSVLVPALSYFLGGFIFGWAKPVPYNPHNLKPGRWPEAFVALAGPLSNITLALIFGMILRFQVASAMNPALIDITALIVFINILLAVFNLLPIPPLDGSKLLFALFPEKLYRMRGVFEQFGLILVILFIFFAWQVIYPIVRSLFILITGLPL